MCRRGPRWGIEQSQEMAMLRSIDAPWCELIAGSHSFSWFSGLLAHGGFDMFWHVVVDLHAVNILPRTWGQNDYGWTSSFWHSQSTCSLQCCECETYSYVSIIHRIILRILMVLLTRQDQLYTVKLHPKTSIVCTGLHSSFLRHFLAGFQVQICEKNNCRGAAWASATWRYPWDPFQLFGVWCWWRAGVWGGIEAFTSVLSRGKV